MKGPIYAGVDRALVRLASGELICVDTNSLDAIDYLLGWDMEADVLPLFRSFLKPNSVVLDIGANFGLYTAISASRMVGMKAVWQRTMSRRVIAPATACVRCSPDFQDAFSGFHALNDSRPRVDIVVGPRQPHVDSMTRINAPALHPPRQLWRQLVVHQKLHEAFRIGWSDCRAAYSIAA